jgi:hypothetical protein
LLASCHSAVVKVPQENKKPTSPSAQDTRILLRQ